MSFDPYTPSSDPYGQTINVLDQDDQAQHSEVIVQPQEPSSIQYDYQNPSELEQNNQYQDSNQYGSGQYGNNGIVPDTANSQYGQNNYDQYGQYPVQPPVQMSQYGGLEVPGQQVQKEYDHLNIVQGDDTTTRFSTYGGVPKSQYYPQMQQQVQNMQQPSRLSQPMPGQQMNPNPYVAPPPGENPYSNQPNQEPLLANQEANVKDCEIDKADTMQFLPLVKTSQEISICLIIVAVLFNSWALIIAIFTDSRPQHKPFNKQMAKVALICFILSIIGGLAGAIGLGFISLIPWVWSIIITVRIWIVNKKARETEQKEDQNRRQNIENRRN